MQVTAKKTVEIQAAWLCEQCKNQIMAMGNSIEAPKACCDCGSTAIKKLWAQKIITMTTVEHL